MKILSIASASGWFARYKDKNGTIHEYPLTCWALVQDAHIKGDDDVVGMMYDREVNLVERADDDSSFDGYRHESEKTPIQKLVEARSQ